MTSPQATVTVPLVARLGLTKAVQTPPPYTAGQQVQYGYTVTNTGGATIGNVAVTDDRISSANLVCQANILAPGASTNCTGTYTVNIGHANAAGRIVNTARATGTTPIGQAVQSPRRRPRSPSTPTSGSPRPSSDPPPTSATPSRSR